VLRVIKIKCHKILSTADNTINDERLLIMITKKFDITQEPLLDIDKAAYLVDSKNVEIHRQYVEKYYSNHDLNWFDEYFREPIRNNKCHKLMLYYGDGYIRLTNDIPSAEMYTIYYINNNALMIVE